MADLRTFTEEELRQADGQEGRPAYVAYQGKVYNVSESRLWRQGVHVRQHQAGRDLTPAFASAPHGDEVFQRVPQVGVLAPSGAEAPPPTRWERLLDLFFGLHPHPVMVHFPIAYTVGVALLLVLFLATGAQGLEHAAYYLLWMGVVGTPLAMLTGALSWWFNYGHKWTPKFGRKIGLSIGLLALGVGALALRSTHPTALADRQPLGWVYFALVVLMVVHAAALGWIGARIVYPSPPPRGGR